MKVRVKSIKQLDDCYGVNFVPFKVGDYTYLGAKVSSSKAKRVKLEVELVAKNPKGDEHKITFGLLTNGMLHPLKRSSALGVELYFKLSTLAQNTIRIVREYRNNVDKTQESDSGGDKKECLVTDCGKEAVIPQDEPMFCKEHEKIMA